MDIHCTACGNRFKVQPSDLELASGVVTCPKCGQSWLHEDAALELDQTIEEAAGQQAAPAKPAPAKPAPAPSQSPGGDDFADFFEIQEEPAAASPRPAATPQAAPARPATTPPPPAPARPAAVPSAPPRPAAAPPVTAPTAIPAHEELLDFSGEELPPEDQTSPGGPAGKAPSAAAGKTDDGLLQDLGDFDQMLKGGAAAPAKEEAMGLDNGAKKFTHGSTYSPQLPPGGKKEEEFEDIFEDIFADQAKKESAQSAPKLGEKVYAVPGSAPPPKSAAAAAVPPAEEAPATSYSQKGGMEGELEDLLGGKPAAAPPASAPSAEPSAPAPEIAGDAGMDFVAPKKKKSWRKFNHKLLLIGAPAALAGLLLVAAALSFFLPQGLFGFQLKDYLTSDYRRPSREVMKLLTARFAEGEKMVEEVSYARLLRAQEIFKDIVTQDTRFRGGHAFLAEVKLRLLDEQLPKNTAEEVRQLLAEAEKWSAGDPQIGFVNALLALKQGDLPAARKQVQSYLEATGGSPKGFALLGKILLREKDQAGALAQFEEALKRKDGYPEALLAKARIKAGQGQEGVALALLEPLTKDPLNLAEAKLAQAEMLMGGSADKSEVALNALIKDQGGLLSPFDQGRAYSDLSQLYEKKGDLDKAAQSLESALQKDAVNHRYTYRLGQLYLQQDLPGKALSQFQAATTLSVDQPSYLTGLAAAQRQLNQALEAQKNAAKAVSLAPQDWTAALELARAKVALGQKEEARQAFDALLQKEPNNYDVSIGSAQLYAAEKEYAKAIAQFQKAIAIDNRRFEGHLGLGGVYLAQKNTTKAMDEFEVARLIDPRNIQVMGQIGEALVLERQFAKASTFFQKVKDKDPKNIQVYKQLAQLEMAQDNPRGAIERLKEGLAVDEKSVPLRILLAQNYLQIKKADESFKQLNEAKALDANNYQLLYWLGMTYRELGDMDNAYQAFNASAAVNPNFPEAFFEMGRQSLKSEEFKEAERLLRKAVEVDANFAPAYRELGDFYLSRNDQASAQEAFLKLNHLEPGVPATLVKIGATYRAQGDNGSAEKYFKQALDKSRGKNVESLLGLGQIYEEKGNFTQAAHFYQNAAKSDVQDPRPHFLLGYLFKSMGKRQFARQAFAKYLRLAPAHAKDRPTAQEELDILEREE